MNCLRGRATFTEILASKKSSRVCGLTLLSDCQIMFLGCAPGVSKPVMHNP